MAPLVGLVLEVGCATPPSPATSPPNVVIVLVDALRADRLGAYGSTRELTPFLDSLAERSYVFRHAYSQAPWTAPSLAALFTSRLPGQLGMTSFQSVLSGDETTLAESFRDHGYSTAAFLAHWFLVGRGFEQGFDAFVQFGMGRKTRGPVLNQEAFDWLDGWKAKGRPVFLYLHYAETHTPYTPPPDVVREVLGADASADLDAVNQLVTGPNRPAGGLTAEQMRRVTDAYHVEVASLDRSLRALFDGLEARGILEHAIVVITADHGEGLQEHGYIGHATSLFNDLIRVPLMIRVPGTDARVDVDEPVSLIDVAPTLLDAAGIEIPRSFEGRTLDGAVWRARMRWLGPLRLLWGYDDADRPVLSERSATFGRLLTPEHDRAIVIGNEKYIAAPGHAGQFYDLAADPGELRGDALGAADRERLRRALADLTRRIEQRTVSAPGIEVDEQSRERMRALGYADE